MTKHTYTECDCKLTDSPKVKECLQSDVNGYDEHHVTFVDDFTVVHNKLLTEWREAGFEVDAFGKNLAEGDNATAVFVREEGQSNE